MNKTIKVFVAASFVAVSASAFAQTSVPEIAYEAVDLLKTPADVFVGEVGGVGQNSKGSIFVYTRTGHPYITIGDNRSFARNGSKLFEFDKTGKFVRELGQMTYGFNAAYGLRVDAQDNVWTVDLAANQFVKFDTAGNVALVLGRKPEAVATRPAVEGAAGGPAANPNNPNNPANQNPPGSGVPGSTFNRPTDIAFDKAGNIYVTDGLAQINRVEVFDKEGRYLRHWGGTGSENGRFKGPKSIAIDASGNVYVADLGNKRVQVFDAQGTYKSQFAGVGTPQTMCMTTGATQYLYISHMGDADGMDDATIFKVKLDGTVVGKFGTAGKLPKQFSIANSIDCRNENELLIGEMGVWRVQKVTLKP